MRLVPSVLVVAFLVFPTVAAGAADPPPALAVGPVIPSCATSGADTRRVRLMIDRRVIGDVGPAIRAVVTATWAPNGLSFEWLDDGPSMTGADIMVVVRRARANAPRTRVLGGAVFDNGRPTGLVLVSIDATMAWLVAELAVRLRLKSADESLVRHFISDRDRGTALGHVIAHEVGHVVLATRTHERYGLMKAEFGDAAAVLRPDPMVLDAHSRQRLSAQLAPGKCAALNAAR